MGHIVTRVALLVVALAALAFALGRGAPLVRDPEDFRAFYCAGRAILADRDPYRAEPLRACEANLARADGLTPMPGLALPAPLPGYALAPFALLALVPFASASAFATLATLVALGATALLVRRMTAFPLVGVLAALALGDGVVCLLNGQIAPLAVASLCAGGYALVRGRPATAAVFVAGAAIEPHLALPAAVALAIAVPRARTVLAFCAVVLGLLSFVTLGVATNVDYLANVLPAHARSELAASAQFGLSAALWRAGVDAATALRLGELSYVIACGVGIATAHRLAATKRAPELLVLVPPAFAVFGGPFVHLTQMPIAVVAALALAYRLPERRAAFALAAIPLALPWQDLAENDPVAAALAAGAVALAVAATVWRPSRRTTAVAVTCAMATAVAERVVRVAAPHVARVSGDVFATLSGGDRLAEATWQAYVATYASGDDRTFAAAHLPTWTALALVLATAVAGAVAAKPDSGVGR